MIVLATGYVHHYPHLGRDLQLGGPNLLYNDHLYKGVVWTEAANGRMFYAGSQNQVYTFTMFDAQALWIAKYISGVVRPVEVGKMREDVKLWMER